MYVRKWNLHGLFTMSCSIPNQIITSSTLYPLSEHNLNFKPNFITKSQLLFWGKWQYTFGITFTHHHYLPCYIDIFLVDICVLACNGFQFISNVHCIMLMFSFHIFTYNESPCFPVHYHPFLPFWVLFVLVNKSVPFVLNSLSSLDFGPYQ